MSMGNQKITDRALVERIEADKTTMAQVKDILGPPWARSRNATTGEETWAYVHGHSSAAILGLYSTKGDSVEIQFRPDGIVYFMGYSLSTKFGTMMQISMNNQ